MERTTSEEMLSLEDAAEFLCVSKSTLYRMLERREVKGRKVGRQWRFSHADLQNYLDRGTQAVVLAQVSVEDVNALLPSLEAASRSLGIVLTSMAPAESREDHVAAYVTQLIRLAVRSMASDLHLAPEREMVAVLLRIDGVLHEICRIPASTYPAVIGQVKAMAAMDIDERAIPQDGRIQCTCEGGLYDMRVSVLPTLYGESAVLRILNMQSALMSLERQQFSDADLARLHRWIASSSGLILCTGPRGSGKTTTLYSCLQAVAGAHKNTMTIEDPIEYQLPFTRQSCVNRRVGYTFPVAMRAFMRHDPDVILVGEIRDRETAEITIQAALTGHLLLSTLHTNNAVSAIRRLVDIGVEPFLIAGSMVGVVAQRLARCICRQCQSPVDLPAALKAHVQELAAKGGFTLPLDAQFYQGSGCDACNGLGFRGRTGLYELLELSHALREAFLNGAREDEMLSIAVHEGMHTLFADGIRKAIEGITTVDEVLRVTMS